MVLREWNNSMDCKSACKINGYLKKWNKAQMVLTKFNNLDIAQDSLIIDVVWIDILIM